MEVIVEFLFLTVNVGIYRNWSTSLNIIVFCESFYLLLVHSRLKPNFKDIQKQKQKKKFQRYTSHQSRREQYI